MWHVGRALHNPPTQPQELCVHKSLNLRDTTPGEVVKGPTCRGPLGVNLLRRKPFSPPHCQGLVYRLWLLVTGTSQMFSIYSLNLLCIASGAELYNLPHNVLNSTLVKVGPMHTNSRSARIQSTFAYAGCAPMVGEVGDPFMMDSLLCRLQGAFPPNVS